MKNKTASAFSLYSQINMALQAAYSIHNGLLGDDAFAGYEGTADDFDRLYNEVLALVQDGCFVGAAELENAWWDQLAAA